MQSGTARTCRSTNARNEEKTFSRNGDPARSVGFAATPAVSSGGRTTIRLWRKSPCGANAAGRRCVWNRKSIAAVPAISEPWRKHTASRYARGAEKTFQSMQGKNASIAAGTAPVPPKLRQRISAGFIIQNRRVGHAAADQFLDLALDYFLI